MAGGGFMGIVAAVLMAVSLNAAPVYLSRPVDPQVCAKKRVDPCGCHHVYGMRHCHPNRKGDHCESPVKASTDVTSSQPQKL